MAYNTVQKRLLSEAKVKLSFIVCHTLSMILNRVQNKTENGLPYNKQANQPCSL